jgi:hypothetical protein
MVIPVRLVWTLVKISPMERLGVAAAFSVGIISIIFAVVRVISLVSKTGSSEVSPIWLTLWSIIEDMVGK